MAKKPSLSASTPDDIESNALYDDAGHDLLTEAFADPSKPNRILGLVVLRTTEAGGHDTAGNRLTKYKAEHIEVAFSDSETKELTALITKFHKRRTQSSTVPALTDPVPDEPLPGMGDGESDDDKVA